MYLPCDRATKWKGLSRCSDNHEFFFAVVECFLISTRSQMCLHCARARVRQDDQHNAFKVLLKCAINHLFLC